MRPVGTIRRSGTRVSVLGVVKGLISEGKLVENLIRKKMPEKVALGISKEELEGLRSATAEDLEELSLTKYENNFLAGLSRFGEVGFPPPCFLAAVDVSDELGIEIVPLDLPEEDFTELYCQQVKTSHLVFHTLKRPVFDRTSNQGDKPEDYAVWWDGKVNGYGGFKVLQTARESHMAREMKKLDGDVLAFIGVARAENAYEIIKSA